MTEPWALVGLGVVLAWVALPLLARPARARPSREPSSLHDRLVLVLVLSAALLAVPTLGARLPPVLESRVPVRLTLHVLAAAGSDATPAQHRAVLGRVVSPFAIVGGLWTIGCALAALRALVLTWRLRRVIGRARRAPEALATRQRELSRALGVCSPALLVSDEVAAPMAFGPCAPVVVFPTSLIEALHEEQHDLVLRHELEHIRRGDLRTSVLVNACAVFFAGHPAARQLVQDIRFAREAAVDAEVSRPDPHAYATLLVEVASLVDSQDRLAHVAMDDTALTRRIDMLTRRDSNEPRRGPRAVIAAAVLAAGLGLVAPTATADPAGRAIVAGAGLPSDLAREIDACFVSARRETPALVIDGVVRVEARKDGHVLAASLPTPQSPSFQRCAEDKAMRATLPPPLDAPLPALAADASVRMAFRIQLPRH